MLDPLREAQAAELERTRRAERLPRARDAWGAWVDWWRSRARELAIAAKISTALAAIAGGYEAARLMLARDVGQAELPKRSGYRLMVDRVDKPTAPDRGK